MPDDLTPTGIATPIDAPDTPNPETTPEADPTTVLAARDESATEPTDASPEQPAPTDGASEAPLHAERPLLQESQWARQRAADEQAALRSLDETVLRPPLDPIDLGQHEQGRSQTRRRPLTRTPLTGSSAQQRPFPWKLVGVLVAFTFVGWLVAQRAVSTRTSNVGLFGVTQQVAQEAVAFEDVEPAEVVPEDDQAWSEPEVESEPEAEADTTSEQEVPEDPIDESYSAEPEPESEAEQDDEQAYTYRWYDYNPSPDRVDTWVEDTSETTPDDTSDGGSVTFDDDGFTYTFDGGSMSYRYGDGYVTVEVDDFGRLFGDGYGHNNYGGHPRGW